MDVGNQYVQNLVQSMFWTLGWMVMGTIADFLFEAQLSSEIWILKPIVIYSDCQLQQ